MTFWDVDAMKNVLRITTRWVYYLFVTMCLVSMVAWIRDNEHEMFVYIQERRKRNIQTERSGRTDEGLGKNRRHMHFLTTPKNPTLRLMTIPSQAQGYDT